jgi:hypothetical protein
MVAGMASSAKDHNGTFKAPKSFQQNKKSWSAIISGGSNVNSSVMSAPPPTPQPPGEPDPLTPSATKTPLVDHFSSSKVARPYLIGTVAHSFVIDITAVLDRKKEFIAALSVFCHGNTHLWSVSELIRKDNERLFAEISVSPSLHQQFLRDPTLQLETFPEPFMAYPSLSPSANVVKLSLSKLPPQYGRQEGGTQQLKEDMHHNLSRYGLLIDCGYVTGGSGIYARGGYAVLAVESSHVPLDHSLNWAYHPIDYSSPACALLPDREQALAFATWAAMPPFCKYCHSLDHALINCEIRKKKLNCDLCNAFGHYRRECPRRNEEASKSGKKRKVSQGASKTGAPKPSSPATSSNAQAVTTAKATAATIAAADAKAREAQAVIDAQAASEAQAAPVTKLVRTAQAARDAHVALEAPVALDAPAAHTAAAPPSANATAVQAAAAPAPQHRYGTRSQSSDSSASATVATSVPPAPLVCKHCGLSGHKMTTSKSCLKNPKRLLDLQGTGSLADCMDTDNVDDDDGSAAMQN